MKNKNRISLFLALFLFVTQGVIAEKYKGISGNNETQQTKGTFKVLETVEPCSPATGSTDLNLNNVRTRINTGGDMWWDLIGTAKYEIPKGSGKTSLFSAALWIGGIDANGNLKVAALRYRQSGNDYWPGPLTTDGTASVDAATCDKYDKHFVITRKEVDDYIAWWNDKSAFPDYQIPKSILDWPAHGDISKNQSWYLAPFFDFDGDDNYNPNNGDYPYYDVNNSLCPTNPENIGQPALPSYGSDPEKNHVSEYNGRLVDQVLKGDQTLWWVFNDKGNAHTESLGAPIGLEIRAQAFAFATNDEINNMTFYSYEIINRSTYRLTETYFSQWIDTDLGDAKDDYVGCDVKRGLGYCYNGDDFDGTGKPQDYGAQPPAVGADFFQGPYMDPDNIDNPKYDPNTGANCDFSINGVNFGNGIVDDERFGMRRFVYHNNAGQGAPLYSMDPKIAIDYYNYLRGIWLDGTKMIYGGNAHEGAGAYGPECDFMFPGDSDPCNWGTGGAPPNGDKYWTEVTAPNQPDDRRFMQSAGPFTLEAGAVNYITVGIPWARASQGGAWASVELLRVVDDKCQRLFDNCFKVIDGPDAPDLTIQELDKELILYIKNEKGSNNYLERYKEWDNSIVTPTDTIENPNKIKYDSLYRFEGYQIFQLKDATVSASEIYNPDKARLVAQCDIENYDKFGNPISQLVNYYYNEKLGGNDPVEEVNGENKGIRHSFRIFNDEFATGDKRLVNHKQYYYLALAYGYNNFMKYSQEPDSQIPGVSGLRGQKKVYLAGRKNIIVYTGIPHNPSPEADGTKQNSWYEAGPKIKRIEGQGNGGMVLDLTEETVAKILANGKDETPEYVNTRGPVDVKVIDPLSVKNSSYTLYFDKIYKEKINNVSGSIVEQGGDTATKFDLAYWVLKDNNTGIIYHSDTNTLYKNEQLFLDLGLSVTINQVWKPGEYIVGKHMEQGLLKNVYAILAKNNGFLEATITYKDSSRRWLGGVSDVDGGGFLNWIRSGTVVDDQNTANSDYLNIDPKENYEKIVNGTWAPYRLCAKKSVDQLTKEEGFGVAWNNGSDIASALATNKMENLASVDIVITPDKSKWTRSCVLEMSDKTNPVLSEGSAQKFDLRAGQSVDKEGNPDGTGTGMGWFPGYAINVETGERLNIMFGENSYIKAENGRDMKWNPTSKYYGGGEYVFGGFHTIYVLGHNSDNDCPAYDECAWVRSKLSNPADIGQHIINKKQVIKDIMWAGFPMLNPGQDFLSNEVKIRIRVAKPYKRYYATSGAVNPVNDDYPMYTFSTGDIRTETNNIEIAKTALDLINVVPNPYYAYSGYETDQLDNRIKITNLPEKCVVTIYSVNGVLVRQYTKDETKTSLDWDLKNYAGIPIAGGMYLIHVKAEGVGERVIKWFGTLRPVDLNSF